MPSTTTSLLLLFILFSSSPHRSSSTPHPRRILHQPIFTTDSPPPSSPPSPPTPDYPFSTPTPPNSAFFPNYPPPPPPPPSPTSLASFPANISSLNLPPPSKSKHTSTTLIITSISIVIAAVIILLIAVFLHLKKRRSHTSQSETKTNTTRSDTSSFNNNPTSNTHRSIPKLTRPSQTSSEFLYLGTLVNSHVVLNQNNNPQNPPNVLNLNPRKMDSPELQPLPPLLRNLQTPYNSGIQNVENGSGRHVDDSEEFYSPRESSIGGGSASRRTFENVNVAKLNVSSSSSSSCSSSVSGSPARSASSSVSPSVSVSPKRPVSRPKSPDLEAVELHAPPLPLREEIGGMSKESLSPSMMESERLSGDLDITSGRVSDVYDNNDGELVKDNVLVFNPFRFSSVLDENDGDHVLENERDLDVKDSYLIDQNQASSPLEDSDEHVPESNSKSSVVSVQNVDSPDNVTGLVVKDNEYFPEQESSDVLDQSLESPKSETMVLGLDVKDDEYFPEPRISDVSDQSIESSKSITMVSGLAVEGNEDFSEPRISDVSDQSVESLKSVTSPVKDNGDSSDLYSQSLDQDVQSPERVTSPVKEMVDVSEPDSTSFNGPDHGVESPVNQDIPVLVPSEKLPAPTSVPPPPPPPPPRKYWESPTTPTSNPRELTFGPPALVAPLRPMVLESPFSISPMQLPTQSENHERDEASVGSNANLDEANERSEETPKPKLKPLHWDKVRASSDREMVWDQLRSSSFKLNEEMIESLFIVKAPNPTHLETTRRQILPLPSQENRVLDAKKSQNIAILLKALHVTVDEVCESLLEGNAETLGTDLLESLLKMAPTKEEEHNLKEHKDDSPVKLGPAERFLKEVLDIPFAFKRVDAMLYISNFDSEVEYLKKSFETLETASEELRNSRMFLKLLEAVLKTGNRMNVGTNRGDAHAFKLDTLLKLVDIKGADGKTTLLHFVLQEITRSEGARISDSNPNQTSATNDDVKCRKLGLQVVSSLGSDLTNVKKAAAMDSEILHSDVMKLSKGLEKIVEVIRLNETIGLDQSSSNKFSDSMNRFMNNAEEEIIRIQAQESVALTLVKEITEYFHGNSAKEEAHPFRIFMVVRDFLSVLERVCKEVGMINERTIVSSAHKFPVPVNPMLQPVSSGFPGRQQNSSSDDESPTS